MKNLDSTQKKYLLGGKSKPVCVVGFRLDK